MHTKLKTIGVVAAVHLALYWAILGILRASGFQLFTLGSLLGFAPHPRNSPVQEFLFGVAGFLTYPLALLPDLPWIPDHWIIAVMAFLLNSAVWGVCLTFLFYAVRQGFQRHAA
jgi:hypothetical protein